MKTLETIQKICKVFYILTKIAMILSFVWAGISAVGAICCFTWRGLEISDFIAEFLAEYDIGEVKTIGIMLADFVFGMTNGVLFFFARRYLKRELADGTPFTTEGAKQMMYLGIKTIVMPLVAIVISSIIYTCFGISQYDKLGNGSSVLLGVSLILVSLILRHGAEIRGENNNENVQDN